MWPKHDDIAPDYAGSSCGTWQTDSPRSSRRTRCPCLACGGTGQHRQRRRVQRSALIDAPTTLQPCTNEYVSNKALTDLTRETPP